MFETLFLFSPLADETGDSDGNQASPISKKLFQQKTWLRVLTGESKYACVLPGRRKVLLPLVLKSKSLPENLNVPLALAFAKAVQRELPVLMVLSKDKLPDTYVAKVQQRLLSAGPHDNLRILRLTETNHVLTTGGAIQKTIDAVQQWMADVFSETSAVLKC
jgi:hypothetical protein